MVFVPVAEEGRAKRRASFCAGALPSPKRKFPREHSIAARAAVVATGVVVGFPEVEVGGEEQEMPVVVMVMVEVEHRGVVLLAEVGVATRW